MWMATAHHIRRMSQASKTLLKSCATCGRQITWRKKWEKNWASITYCSDSCRKQKPKPHSLDTHLESTILSLLLQQQKQQQATGKTALDTASSSDNLHQQPHHRDHRQLLTCEDVEAHISAERSRSRLHAVEAREIGGGGGGGLVGEELEKGAGATEREKGGEEDEVLGAVVSGGGGGEEQKDPKRMRERCRRAARRLAARGEVVIVQEGKVVADPSFAKGVMGLRLPWF